MNNVEKRLAVIKPAQRVLLLSHCLRRTDTCKNKYDEEGLDCQECNPECPVNRLRKAAISIGYKGVCVAPGGKLAVKYVKKKHPQGIVAVACQKELEEGVDAVTAFSGEYSPPIVIVPLTKDGCIDTEVDEDRALEVIYLGCELAAVKVKARS